jgi:hypothetical protein
VPCEGEAADGEDVCARSDGVGASPAAPSPPLTAPPAACVFAAARVVGRACCAATPLRPARITAAARPGCSAAAAACSCSASEPGPDGPAASGSGSKSEKAVSAGDLDRGGVPAAGVAAAVCGVAAAAGAPRRPLAAAVPPALPASAAAAGPVARPRPPSAPAPTALASAAASGPAAGAVPPLPMRPPAAAGAAPSPTFAAAACPLERGSSCTNVRSSAAGRAAAAPASALHSASSESSLPASGSALMRPLHASASGLLAGPAAAGDACALESLQSPARRASTLQDGLVHCKRLSPERNPSHHGRTRVPATPACRHTYVLPLSRMSGGAHCLARLATAPRAPAGPELGRLPAAGLLLLPGAFAAALASALPHGTWHAGGSSPCMESASPLDASPQ